MVGRRHAPLPIAAMRVALRVVAAVVVADASPRSSSCNLS